MFATRVYHYRDPSAVILGLKELRKQGLTPRGRGTDFWNRYEGDIAAAAGMGCKLFRFSIAWARVDTAIPSGGTCD